MMRLRSLCGAIAGIGFALAASGAGAQTWPTRQVTVVTPFNAGSAADAMARVVLDQVSQQTKQAFVIENRTGAGGTIGAANVARADPDGYTLLVSSSSMGSQIVFHKSLSYDVLRDFVHVSLLGVQPNVLVVAPSSGFKTVADLVAAAKAKPGTLTFASAGVGSASHMAGERLRVAAKVDVQHVPFRGGNGLTEVLAGRIDFYYLPLAAAAPLLATGKVRALAVSTRKRVPLLPDVPSVAEAGYPEAEYLFWAGLSVPAATPRPVIDALHRETEKALQTQSVREKLDKFGVQEELMSVEEFGKFFHDEIASIVQLAKDAHLEATE